MMHPRTIGVACATAATGLGIVYMTAAGAPTINLAVNAIALMVGLAIFAFVPAVPEAPRRTGVVIVALGASILVTALAGVAVEGASRWIRIGGLAVQPSLILVPVILLGFARRQDLPSAAGVILTALALAIQPDRAMAGVLAAGLAVLVVRRRSRWVAVSLGVAVAAFTVTMLRPDTLPAVPYVDQVFYTAFDVHVAVGLSVVGGALLLIVPAIAGHRTDPEHRHVYSVFGMTWFGIAAAAAIGNYPTPLVGYGASAVLGYMLSLSTLPRTGRLVAADGERMAP